MGALAFTGGVLTPEAMLFFAVLIPSVVLHEVAHGAVALMFGDPTARDAGRLTLNPIPHIDPVWTIILPAFMVLASGRAFGMAKPVPVNPRRMRHPRHHGLLTSLAGPATNIVLAVVAGLVLRLRLASGGSMDLGNTTLAMLGVANVILAAFNLLPIPPLDGSAVIEWFLPRRYLVSWLRLRQYSFFVFIALFFFSGDLFGRALNPAVELWLRFVTA